MRNFKRVILGAISALATLAVSCTDAVDMSLGSDFIPDGQIMGVGELDLRGVDREGRSITSSRLFKSERINAAKQSFLLLGLQHDEEFGLRRSGFFTQYTPLTSVDEDDLFGNEPFLDSMVIFLAMSTFSGDTTYVQTFEVYEVLDDTFLTSSADTVFHSTFDLLEEGVLGSEPLFEFVYPDQANDVYLNSSYVMSFNITESANSLADKLMLKDDAINYSIYDGDFEEFVENFKGLYIVPKENSVGRGEGATYAFDPTSSGFGFYGRSLYEEDPTIVADTITMIYKFYDTSVDDVGGVSIQHVTHDYSDAEIDLSYVKGEANLDVSKTNRIRIEGLGGVISEITFERALFDELELALAEGGDDYTNMFFNLAVMKIYFEMARGIDPLVEKEIFTEEELDLIGTYPNRLGLYQVYSTFYDDDGDNEIETVPDYDYASEWMYSSISNIGGYLNRTQGCYQLNIPLQLQDMWNEYLEAKEDAGGDADAIDWDNADWNKIYIAPLVENLFAPQYVTLQGGAGTDNLEGTETIAPIRLNITYTLLKK